MKKLKVIEGVWFGGLFLAAMLLVGKFINQMLDGHGLFMLPLSLLLLAPAALGMLYIASRILDDDSPGFTLLSLAIASVYVGALLYIDAPRQAVQDQLASQKARDDFEKAPPRRFVDKEAQVVCYESREFDGDRPALFCLPISQTALKAGAQ